MTVPSVEFMESSVGELVGPKCCSALLGCCINEKDGKQPPDGISRSFVMHGAYVLVVSISVGVGRRTVEWDVVVVMRASKSGAIVAVGRCAHMGARTNTATVSHDGIMDFGIKLAHEGLQLGEAYICTVYSSSLGGSVTIIMKCSACALVATCYQCPAIKLQVCECRSIHELTMPPSVQRLISKCTGECSGFRQP